MLNLESLSNPDKRSLCTNSCVDKIPMQKNVKYSNMPFMYWKTDRFITKKPKDNVFNRHPVHLMEKETVYGGEIILIK